MSRISIASFVSPAIGLVLFLLIPREAAISSSFLVWFAIAALLQATGAVMLLVKQPVRWTYGVICFWLAAACYMGGYSDLHLQAKALTGTDEATMAVKTTIVYLQYVMSLLFVAVFGSLGAVSSREVQESHGLEIQDTTRGRPVHD